MQSQNPTFILKLQIEGYLRKGSSAQKNMFDSAHEKKLKDKITYAYNFFDTNIILKPNDIQIYSQVKQPSSSTDKYTILFLVGVFNHKVHPFYAYLAVKSAFSNYSK